MKHSDIMILNKINKIAEAVNTSPKGVYDTKALLEAAFPTGNNNIYVVSADGNWYYWSGTAWEAGGLYQTVDANLIKIADTGNLYTATNVEDALQENRTLINNFIPHLSDLITDVDGAHGLKIETGSWTPTLTSGSNNNNVYSIQQGTYYKIGKLVVANFNVGLTTKDSSVVGGLMISGLPFLSVGEYGPTFSRVEGITLKSDYTNVSGYSFRNSVAIIQTKGTWDVVTFAEISNTTRFRGSITYIAN